MLVETTDLIFAVDSIPAVFAVTRDPFLVYSSNVFAILGLRALYFLLSGVIGKFRYLKFGLSVVLIFVGAKMLLADVYKVPIGLSLGIIALVIGASILTSLFFPARAGVASTGRRDRRRRIGPRACGRACFGGPGIGWSAGQGVVTGGFGRPPSGMTAIRRVRAPQGTGPDIRG